MSLKAAREAAGLAIAKVAKGIDPIKERQDAARVAIRNRRSVRDVAVDAFESRKAELKGDGQAGRWFSPLELHVLPKLGSVPMADITAQDVRDCLKPIWHAKAPTALKALERLGIVLKHGAALGLDVDMQAIAKARQLLGVQRHVTTSLNAMPWQDVPLFYQSLDAGTPTELALRLTILTGLRSTPIRMARLDQFSDGIWIVPAENMKGRVGRATEFRVPLTQEMLSVVAEASPFARDGFLFPSRAGSTCSVISDNTLSKYMRDREIAATPHGFRSSLRDWIAETQVGTPHEVAEMVISHGTDSKVVRAYRRTDFLEQRRRLMELWSDHCLGLGSASIHPILKTGT